MYRRPRSGVGQGSDAQHKHDDRGGRSVHEKMDSSLMPRHLILVVAMIIYARARRRDDVRQ
jgi:hypothetical protein